jgi:hypothetical protein
MSAGLANLLSVLTCRSKVSCCLEDTVFEKMLTGWLNFAALPLYATERSPYKGVRILGALLVLPWFLGLALIGPIVLGSVVILLFGLILEEICTSK